MAIGNARRWAGGQILRHSEMNAFVSLLLEQRAGRHGVVELEDSLSILNGDDGDRYFQLPVGTTAQRPADPEPGYLRFNSTLSDAEYWNGTAWRPFQQLLADVLTFANLNRNGAVGDEANQVSQGNHVHPGVEITKFTVSPVSGKRGDTVSCEAAAITRNGNEPRYRWSASPNVGTFSHPNAAETTWTMPRLATATKVTITVAVDDRVGAPVRKSESVEVAAQLGPTVTAVFATQVRGSGGLSMRLSSNAADGDGDTLTYSWSVSPSTGSLSGRTSATATWRPSSSSVGRKHSFSLSVSDGMASASGSGGSVTPEGPSLTSVSASFAGGRASLSASARAGDGGALSYSWSVSPNTGTWTNRTRASATWTPNAASAGRAHTFTCTVSNNLGSASQAASTTFAPARPGEPVSLSFLGGSGFDNPGTSVPFLTNNFGIASVSWRQTSLGDFGTVTRWRVETVVTASASAPTGDQDGASSRVVGTLPRGFGINVNSSGSVGYYWIRIRAEAPVSGAFTSWVHWATKRPFGT